jgi:CHASE2 domain-containing sensor protein
MDYKQAINLFHIAVVAPLLVYIGYQGKEAGDNVFTALIIIALGVIAYHGFRYYSTGWWINLMHVFAGLALIVLGWIGTGLPDWGYWLYYILAAVTIGWHVKLLF